MLDTMSKVSNLLVTAYMHRGNIAELLKKKIMDAIYQYDTNESAKGTINNLQYNLQCCGSYGPSDWRAVVPYSYVCLKSERVVHYVPNSCQQNENEECFRSTYQTGCYQKLVSLLNDSAFHLIVGTGIIGLLQMAGIIFACLLGHKIIKQKTNQKMSMWQKQLTLEGIHVHFNNMNQ
ncbi:tetraspanin-9-like [Copidosoma floridanum]|uniref:tetraspanin-9-like n=1 Tax=Copidosoma floridanum TaxID=29053 RepID=UPI0006C94CA6|nr:tetraspanin-9-like [Copidosoma floridanum]